mgnify:CR=1 FL=1
MALQVIKDKTGRRLGEIRETGPNKLTIYDATNRRKGEYDKTSDTTYDASNRRVGKGNLLATLL